MTIKSNSISLRVALGVLALALGTGCKDDEEDIERICLEKPDCPDESADEVGDGDGDKPEGEDEGGEDDPRFCITRKGQGERTVYQCNGHLTASMQFQLFKKDCAETLGSPDWCMESHSFGVGFEPYEMPAVMACCDANETPEDELLKYCAMDLVEQVCRSIPMRLENMIKDGVIPDLKQAKNLVSWLKNNQQHCYDTLHQPSDSPGIIIPVVWKVNGGDNKDWKLLDNLTITLEKGVVLSASLPDNEEDYLTCEDSRVNNDEVFEERGPISPPVDIDVYHLGDSFDTQIMGPTLADAARVVGWAKSVSQSLCKSPRCASLELGADWDNDLLVLEELSLFAEGSTSIAYGDLPIEVDGVALRLYGASHGSRYFRNDVPEGAFIIDAGGAHFIVSGALGDSRGTRWAANETPIVLQESDGGWTLESFTVVYTDAGGTWRAVIPQTTWN